MSNCDIIFSLCLCWVRVIISCFYKIFFKNNYHFFWRTSSAAFIWDFSAPQPTGVRTSRSPARRPKLLVPNAAQAGARRFRLDCRVSARLAGPSYPTAGTSSTSSSSASPSSPSAPSPCPSTSSGAPSSAALRAALAPFSLLSRLRFPPSSAARSAPCSAART